MSEECFDLAAFAAERGVADPEGFTARIRRFQALLREENAKYNLTRIVESPEFEVKHVADSLAIAGFFPELAREALRIADVGCGAGFPSVVLAAAFPNLSITAIDSTGKKANFVRLAAETLDLPNLRVVCGRAVELNRKPEFQDAFDVVTARAVAPAAKLFKECSKFPRKKGGRFLFYQSPQQAEAELPELFSLTRRHWHRTEAFELPGGAGSRLFLYS